MSDSDLYQCPYCEKKFSKMGIKGHIWRKHTISGQNFKNKSQKGLIPFNKGKTYEELFGIKGAKKVKEKLSKSLTGKSTGKASTIEKENNRKQKIALSMKGNKNGATSFRRRNIVYKDAHFKSSWEVNVAKYLDENTIQWKYENIQYSLSETESYTPDFSIYENDIFIKHIEVKGYWRIENKEKFNKFQQLYPDIIVEIWDKKILCNKKIKT